MTTQIFFSELTSSQSKNAIMFMAKLKGITNDEMFNLLAYTNYNPNDEFSFEMSDNTREIFIKLREAIAA